MEHERHVHISFSEGVALFILIVLWAGVMVLNEPVKAYLWVRCMEAAPAHQCGPSPYTDAPPPESETK